jgi:NUMOD3 motif
MSEAAKKKLSLALKGKKHPHKGHPVSLDTKRKISAALRCHARSHGTCHKVKPQTAHKIERRLIKALHQKPGAKKCPANKIGRHNRVTDRTTSHIHRHVMHNVRKQARHDRKVQTPRWEHLVETMPAKKGRRLLRLEREWRKRERSVHQARLHCHTAHRKAAPKIKKRRQCPKGQQKRRPVRSRIKG